jgi:hypothetical protein
LVNVGARKSEICGKISHPHHTWLVCFVHLSSSFVCKIRMQNLMDGSIFRSLNQNLF